MKIINVFISASFLLSLFLLTGCLIPESNHVEPRYHLLTALDFESNGSKYTKGISFHIREVNIPPYLEDNRIVSRASNSTVNYREHDRWAEPLSEGISRVAAKNLARIFDTLNFSAFPHRPKQFCLYEVSLAIQHFEKTSGNEVFLDVIIGIYNKNQLVEKFRYKQTENIRNFSVDEEINALSECLQKVCQQLGQAIEDLPLTRMENLVVDEVKFVNESPVDAILRLGEIYSENFSESPDLKVLFIGDVQTKGKLLTSVYKNQNLYDIYLDVCRICGLKITFDGHNLRLSKIY